MLNVCVNEINKLRQFYFVDDITLQVNIECSCRYVAAGL